MLKKKNKYSTYKRIQRLAKSIQKTVHTKSITKLKRQTRVFKKHKNIKQEYNANCLRRQFSHDTDLICYKMTQQPQQISLFLMIACTWGLDFHLTTWYGRWWISHLLSFMSLFQWLIKADDPINIFFCQIKILCLQIFLVTCMICGWKCLVDKDRYWETENSCYRNPVLLQRSYWKISYYGKQNKYSWDQLNRLGKSVIEGTNKSIYS